MKKTVAGLVLLMGIPSTLFAEPVPVIDVDASQVPTSVNNLSAADERSGMTPADGGAWLTEQAGVTGVRMGSHGLDPVIHGQKYNQLNVLLDGAYVFGGCPNRMDPPSSYASAETYDQLTVIKGVQSLLYGGGGSGGTVLFERLDPVFKQGRTTRVEVGAGYVANGDAWAGHTDIASGSEGGFVRGILSAKEADPYKDGDGNDVRSGYQEQSAVLDMAYRTDNGSRWDLSLEAVRGEDILYAGAGMDAPLSDHDLIKLAYETASPVGPFSRIKAELYNSAVEHLMDNYTLRPNSMMWAKVPSESDTTGGRLQGDISMSNGVLTLGIDAQYNDRDAARYAASAGTEPTVINSYLWPGVSIEQLGMVAEYAGSIATHARYTAGLRVDRVDASASKADLDPIQAWSDSPNTLYNTYYGTTAYARNETNVGALLRYEQDIASPDTSWFVGLSRTVRSADATERFMASDNMSTPSQIWVGNPGLEPEAHHQLDMGIKHTRRSVSITATLYYDTVSDYILRDTARGQDGILLADQATIYRNVDAELYGVDIEGHYQWSRQWQSEFSVAYVHATNTTDERPIAQTPPLEGNLSLDYIRGNWLWGGQLRAVAQQTRVDDDPATGSGLDVGPTPGFTVYNLYARYTLDTDSQVHFGVDNVTDKTYAEHLNKANAFDVTQVQVNEPGRSYWARLNIVF